jgi:pSer/pThr/pTyr-binding forkhead associated (FHA) protein
VVNAAKPAIPAVGTLEVEVLAEGGSQARFQFSAPGVEGYIIGRSDTKSTYTPDIDLTAYNALQKGLSRRHAALVSYQGMVHVLDLSSVNGTFLNGQRLAPEVPYPVRTGDKLRLGNFNIQLSRREDE